MTSRLNRNFTAAIGSWVHLLCRHALAVVVLAALLTIGTAAYTVTHIGINTNTVDMLSPDLPFRKNSNALSDAFPQFSDNVVIVLDGANPDQVADGADALVRRLKKQPELFGDVFDLAGDPFFRKNGLLYLDTDKLEELSVQLAAAQPFLGRLWNDPSLVGLLDTLALILNEGGNAENKDTSAAAASLIDRITAIAQAQAAGKSDLLAWRTVISGGDTDPDDLKRVIVIQPKTDFTSLHPGEEAIKALRRVGQKLRLQEDFSVRMRLTGSLPMADEELESVVDGLGLAGFLSLAMVLILLTWGLKSVRLVVTTLITLIFGLIWTAGFATLTVGTLNLISVAFAVLFIGLSVDFGIHYGLRYKECIFTGSNTETALIAAAEKVGGALFLSALAAAIGFFSFLPTDYLGLAELGTIAGTGMFIALFANLTLLPALLKLLPLETTDARPAPELFGFSVKLIRYRGPIVTGAVILGLASSLLASRANFDFDPLNLKDPSTESVSTFFDLMESGGSGPYTITVLAENLSAAKKLGGEIEALAEVDDTVTLYNFLPDDQDKKLAILDSAALILLPSLSGDVKQSAKTDNQRQKVVAEFRQALATFSPGDAASVLAVPAHNLLAALDKLKSTDYAELERRLLAGLPQRLLDLRRALSAEEVSLSDIPVSFKDRQIATDGRARLEVIPKGDMRERVQLTTFVTAVQKLAPDATGNPVVIMEGGDAVVGAFIEAAVLSVGLIAILVIYLTRGIREIILIFTPLLLAALFTLSASVMFNLPFNFANVIVLPLLFGLGIASGIHLVLRERHQKNPHDMIRTSTPRAIFFSALTTIGSFGSIALSSHPGTSSMGILLTIAITLSLICTLGVLPAFMALWQRSTP